jgi:hypothetical protein
MSYDTDAQADGRRPWALVAYHPDGEPGYLIDGDSDLLIDASGRRLGDDTGSSPLYFSLQSQPVPLGFDVPITAPCLREYPRKQPLKVDPSRGIGVMQQATVTLQDFPHPDGSGHYFRRLKRNSPYYLGKPLRIYTGYITESGTITSMRSELWAVEKWDGPDPTGKITITCSSLLRQTDERKAQAPLPNTGATQDAITSGATPPFDITVTPAGVGDEEYGSSGVITIGPELFTFSGRSGDVITVSARAQSSTEAVEHESGSTVQEALSYTEVNAVDILRDLLVGYTPGVDATNIPDAEWDTEKDWVASQNYTAVIAKPIGVNKLITEICQQAMLMVWWDGESEQMRLRAIRPRRGAATVYGDGDTILHNSFRVKDVPDKRVSRVRVLYGQINPLKNLDDEDNYSVILTSRDSASEALWGEPAIRTIYSRWMTTRGQAVQLGGRITSQYPDIPEEYHWSVDASARTAFPIGDIGTIQTRQLEDGTGAARQQDVLITGLEETTQGHTWRVIGEQSVFAGRYAVIAPDLDPGDGVSPFPDYPSASEAIQSSYGFIAYDDRGDGQPGFLDGTDPYKII